jgi:4-amino-4-deoxy-L-arabinose transferase-like glycosyltransferase
VAIGATALFLALHVWWTIQDRSVPISDAGFHLEVSIEVFEELKVGDFSKALGPHIQYPPLLYLIASIGLYFGGLSVQSVVIALNLFFVPLLALGCYQLGRLAFGPRVGLLAVVFALGSPLIASLFHIAMLDAPQAAMAAVSVWLILATRYFKDLRYCVLAGVAVSLGMLTKESLALFVIGPLAVTFVRGGWRNWRGLLAFGLVVGVVAGPWYLSDFTQVREIGTGAANSGTIGKTPLAPPRFSSENLQWYAWSFLGTVIFLPLFLFAAVGGVWTIVGFIRRRWVSPFAPELIIGAFVAWFGLTQTFVHDNRYGMSMLVYFAMFGSFWIVRLPRWGRLAAVTALGVVVLANTLATSFGVGGIWRISLPQAIQSAKDQPNTMTLYSNEGYLLPAAPERKGNVLGMLRELKKSGEQGILMVPSEAPNEGPFEEGMLPLATIAGLHFSSAGQSTEVSNIIAVLDHEVIGKNKVPPCVTLGDGTGIWVRIGNPYAAGAKNYCPSHKPRYYAG